MGCAMSPQITKMDIPNRTLTCTFVVLAPKWAVPSWTLNFNPKQNGGHGVPCQGGKQARFSLLTFSSKEPETHEAQPFVLQSHVMQCRRFSWQVTQLQGLVKALSRFTACSGTVSAKRDLQTRWRKCCKVHVCLTQRSLVLKSLTRTGHSGEINWWINLTLRCCQLDNVADLYTEQDKASSFSSASGQR